MIKGINQNNTPAGTPPGYAFYGKNIIINRRIDAIINEKGTQIVTAFDAAGVTNIIGVIPFGPKVVIFYQGTAPLAEEKFTDGDFEAPNNNLYWQQINGTGTHTGAWTYSGGKATGTFSADQGSKYILQPVNVTVGKTATISGTFTRLNGFARIRGQFFDAALQPVGNAVTFTTGGPATPTLNFNSSAVVPNGATYFGFLVSVSPIVNFITGVSNPNPQTCTIDNVSLMSEGSLTQSTDRIGVYDEISETFEEKISRTDLDFDELYPITGEAKLNSKQELIVAFTDNNTFPKYINLDTAKPSDSVELYNLSFIAKNPNMTAEVVEGAGAFKSGCHFVSMRYIDKNKAGSNYSPLSAPVYIVSHTIQKDFRQTQGTDGGLITNKGIRVTLTNLDPSFNKLQVAIVSRMKGVVTAAKYKDVSYTGTSVTFVITGSEVTTPLTIEQVVTINQVFDKVAEIEALDDQLFLADLTLAEVTDFQSLVNQFTVEWTSTPYYNVIEDIEKTSINDRESYYEDGNKKGLIHDEIYAIYAQLELPNGRFSEWFHIPGREPTSGERQPSTIANGVKLAGGTPKRFQIEDTCTYGGNTGNIANNTLTAPGYAYGNMGVWENQDEVYPPEFPDFAGEKVRHHKTPSVYFLKENVYTNAVSGDTYLRNMWDTLGIRVNFGDIPAEFADKFIGIRIGYAKRDPSSMTVLGYDIIQYAANPQNPGGATTYNGGIISACGGNWFVNAVGADNNWSPDQGHIRLHSPDVFILRPNIDDIYLSNIMKYRLTDMNNEPTGQIDYGRIVWNNDENTPVWVYVSNFRYAATQSLLASGFRYTKLDNTKFIPNNVTIDDPEGTINNLLNEEVIHGKIEMALGIQISGFDGGGAFITDLGDNPGSPNLYEESALTVVKTAKSNLFISYKDQIVIPMGQVVKVFDTPAVINKEGDAFIAFYSFLCMATAPNLDGPFTYEPNVGIRNVKSFLCESRFNLNQRYITIGDYNTYFYPYVGGVAIPDDFTQYWYMRLNQQACPVNQIQYSKDFNTINEYEQYGVYDHTADYENEIPFAIGRSQKASRATDIEDGWRVFKPNDIFYTVRDKGRIKNLVAWGTDSLLIHHERGLFKTRDKTVLQSDIGNISLGSGELFALEPAEVAPTEYGYGGLQNRYAAILCEAGYIFIDAYTGEIFGYKGGENLTVLGKGLRTFFEQVFRDQIIEDNPLNVAGITMAFDKLNYRLLLSLKALVGFTVSFDLIKEEWAAFHDYFPDLLVNTRKKIYAFKDNTLHEHNKGPVGSFYGNTFPSFVDLVINDAPTKEKVLAAIAWFTEVTVDGVNYPNDTLSHITVWNDHFCTGKIAVTPQTNLAEYDNKNTKKARGGWSFNSLKDAVVDPSQPFVYGVFNDYRPISTNIDQSGAWFDHAELRGTYFIVRLEYSNIEDKSVSLRAMQPEIRLSSE